METNLLTVYIEYRDDAWKFPVRSSKILLYDFEQTWNKKGDFFEGSSDLHLALITQAVCGPLHGTLNQKLLKLNKSESSLFNRNTMPDLWL